MRLSKLKLAGFKSFVDPTVVVTPGQLVGIVGPNGCGKSNLIDAVRWVLGESRASALRGESMQDVIFNGSSTRKAVSRASVELVFDNGAGRASGQWSQYAEIAVRRVVERSGGSDYFINGIRVRRKDVIDLLLGTGLGPRAYAIIEQGMISRVIEARPEEVRAFLEEAAGITKYKERRRETEGRLADASENLVRVEDIRVELGQQLERLAEQAKVARRYKEIQSALQVRQALLWRLRYTIARQDLDGVAAQLGDAEVALEERNTRLLEVEARLLLAREAMVGCAEAVTAAQGDLYAITAELTRVEGEIKRLRDRRERIDLRTAQLGAESAAWGERLNAAADERERWAALREHAARRLEHASELAEDARMALPQAEHAWRDAVAARDQWRRASAATEQQMRVAETRRAASLRALDALDVRRRRLDADLAALAPVDAEELSLFEASVADLVERQQAARDRNDVLSAQQRETQHQLAQARDQVGGAERRVTECRARLQALRSLQSRLRDQGDLAKWMHAVGLAGQSALWQALHVEAGWELAVEAVLRERVGALGPLGGELPEALLTQPAPATVVVLRDPPACSEPRDFCPLPMARLVQCDDPLLAPFLASWLQDVYAVEDAAAWLGRASALPQSVRLVSRTGQILARDSLTLFAPDARLHGAIERQSEIEALEKALAADEGALAAAQEALSEQAERVQLCREALAQAQTDAQHLQAQRHAAELQLVKLEQARARHQDRQAQYRSEAAEIEALTEQEREHLESAEAERLHAQARREEEGEALREAEATLGLREEALHEAREAASMVQRSLQDAEFSLRECQSKLEETERGERLALDQLAKVRSEQAQLATERDAVDEVGLQTALQTALDLRRGREAALAGRRGEQEEAAQTVRTLDEARLRLEHELGPLREQLGELKLRRQAAELAVTQTSERLGEMGVEIILLDPVQTDEIKEASLTREVARLNREQAELGVVNLAALQELEATTARKDFLDSQYEDLTRAIGTLQDAIRRIDRETREQLLATHETVNRHFGELFPRLFGGGEAQLVLSGEEILDAGVQIVARPPGKKNSTIHLLSGGEKALTAIALVFAMFLLNPAPFCMLDEVDAPLDDANTERYCEMVKHMSAVTQFVFISHSKITMEMARQLVGVTMQEQGVSRVVEVDIEAAMELATPAVA